MKKSYIILSLFLAVGAVLFANASKIFSAESVQRFTVQDKEVYNLLDTGVVSSSSGYRTDRPLVSVHETFNGITPPSSTWIVGQVMIQSTGTINLLNGSTTFQLTTSSGIALFYKQPQHPRQLEFMLNGATANVVIIGTNAFGQSVRDTLTLTSGTKQFSHDAFVMISSFSINITTTIVDRSTFSISVGISTGIGLAYKYDAFSSTSLLRTSENGSFLSLSSYTLNSAPGFYMVNFATSHPQATTNTQYAPREIHYLNRQTLYGD